MIGAVVLGEFRIESTVAGGWDWGLHFARGGEREVLVATTSPHHDDIATLRARFSSDAVLRVGSEEHEGRPVDVLVEARPRGQQSTAIAIAPGDDLRILGKVAWRLRELHARKLFVGSLRPDLIFVEDRRELGGIAPYTELFFRGIAPHSSPNRYPFEELYMAPEMVRGDAAVAASDVFCLAACLVRWRLGRYPIPGASFIDRLVSLGSARFADEVAALDLPEVIRRALAADPAQRPMLDELTI